MLSLIVWQTRRSAVYRVQLKFQNIQKPMVIYPQDFIKIGSAVKKELGDRYTRRIVYRYIVLEKIQVRYL